MKRARSTAAPRPRRRACHTVDLIQYRTRLAYRKKRPSGPGILGHHNLIYEVGPSDQTRRPYSRDTKAPALPLRFRTPLVTAVVFPACHSSNSRRRSGAARAPATAVYRWWQVAGYSQKRACSVSVRSAAARRSLFSSSRAAPRAPLLLMQRRRAPATACPCARAAGAWGCPCYLGRLPRPPTNGCAIRVWCVRANAAARCAFGCFRLLHRPFACFWQS